MIPNKHAKDDLSTSSRPSLRGIFKLHKFSAEFNGGRSAKTAILISLDFSKSKTLWAVLVLFLKIVHQRVSLGKI